jgi:aspartate racemase
MSKHIGIVGVSPEGAALFYRELSRLAGRHLPPNETPRISIHNEPLAQYIDAIRRDDWHAVGRLLRRSAELLARCGATIALTPDNAVQHAVPLAEVGSPIPWLTMTDLVSRRVAQDGLRTVGVIGTSLVTRSSTYQTHLGLRGVQVLPPDDDDIETLDQIIFGELIYGEVRAESCAQMHEIIARLGSKGCEGVILACSEAPLVVARENSPLPLYVPAEVLAESAMQSAVDTVIARSA